MPVVVLLVLAFTAVSGGTSTAKKGPLPALSFSAIPLSDAAIADCALMQEQLPISLNGLAPRIVHTAYTVAWGDPAVVVQCGVARPKDLVPNSAADYYALGPASGPFYDIQKSGDANVYTTVDRAVYIAVTVPAKYQGADEVPPISQAIAKALPAVCVGVDDTGNVPTAKLCANRK